MVATGAILPEHYLAEGGNANRATAAEMGLPSIKRFQRRQQVFRALLTAPLDAVEAAVARLSGAFSVAAERGWVTQEEARRRWWRYAGQVDESAPQEGEDGV
jgi:hypothetical protein